MFIIYVIIFITIYTYNMDIEISTDIIINNTNNIHYNLQYFLKHANHNYIIFRKNLIHDKHFLNIKTEDIIKENLKYIFNKIYEYLKVHKLEKSINWIIKSYINNNFGFPSSFENIGRYKDSMNIYNKLVKNKSFIQSVNKDFERILINQIDGLIKLEEYINSQIITEIIQKIDDKNTNKKKKKNNEKEKKVLGEKDVNIILDNEDVIIYHPTTENGSKYYGKNTRWCTASENGNMFESYNKDDPIYIIESKKTKQKYQIHRESKQCMNEKDKAVSIRKIINNINNEEFTEWMITNMCFNNDKTIFYQYYPLYNKFDIDDVDDVDDVDDFHDGNDGNYSCIDYIDYIDDIDDKDDKHNDAFNNAYKIINKYIDNIESLILHENYSGNDYGEDFFSNFINLKKNRFRIYV